MAVEVYGVDSNGNKVLISGPSTAPVNPDGTEIKAPTAVNPNDYPPAGGPTTPAIARGIVANTAISQTNSDLAHVCDFTLELQKNMALKKFLQSQADTIREAIRSIKRLLGLSDGTGQYSWLIEKLKKIKKELQYIANKILKPINDFKKIVIDYVNKIKEILAWIASLPAKILKFLKQCLAALLSSIKNVLSDVIAPDAGVKSDADLSKELKEVQAAIKDTTATVTTIVADVSKTVTTAAKDVSSAVSTQELASVSDTPTSLDEVNSQERAIQQFANSLPTEEELAEQNQAYQINEAHV